MANHGVTVKWTRETEDFTYQTYNRDHTWHFDGGESVRASAAADYLGNAACVDPEQAFVASLAACHMLVFLALAANKGLNVISYEDQADGILDKNDKGKMAVTKVILMPRVQFEGDAPDAGTLDKLHHMAHRNCFIANSVTTEIEVRSPT